MTEPGMEPAVDPSAVGTPEPVAPPTQAGAVAGMSRGRWLIAGGVTAVAVVIAVGAAILLGGRPVPEALTYVPADSAVVAELRMDLPGDQLQKVGNLLAHFPGFKDQTTLSQKLDESFERIARGASNGSVDYQTQIKPWLAGPLFAASGAAPANGDRESFLLVATTDGTPTCDAALKAIGNGRGPSPAPLASPTAGSDGVVTTLDGAFACARDGRFGLLGSTAMVRAGLAAHAQHHGMDTNTAYRTARDTLGGDRLATIYLSKAAMSAGPMASDLPLASGELAAALGRVPDWAIGGVSAEDDALVADLVTASIPAATAPPGSPLPTLPPAHKSRIAPLLPGDTVALVDAHGIGTGLQIGLAQLRADPRLGESLGQVDTTLQALGGVGGLVGWIDDAGIAVVPDGSSVTGGVILLAPDETTASSKAQQLKGLLGIFAIGGKAQIRQETIAGVDVTVLDIVDIGGLLGGVPGAPSLPVPLPPGQPVSVAFASKADALLVGPEAFVKRVLETQSGSTLAESAAYMHALKRAPAENLSQVYVGTAPLLALGEELLPDAEVVAFDSDIKPYVEPFDAILVTTTMDRGGVHVRLVATVK
jgi:hypothetical protein